MIRRRSGYVSNPPSSGGGGASTQYLEVADGTEIGSSGRVTDAADNGIAMVLPDGTGAAVTANGLSSLYGGCWWDLGGTLKGSIQFAMEWVGSAIAQTHVVAAVWRSGSDPTSIQDIEDAGAHYVQILTNSTTKTSTFLKEGTAPMANINNENQAGSERIHYSCHTDDNQIGAHSSLHEHGSTSTDRVDSTNTAVTSGNWYCALLYGAQAAVSGSDKTITIKMRGGMPL